MPDSKPQTTKDVCMCCGMSVAVGEYHPYAACLMFKASGNDREVRAQLRAVIAYGRKEAANAKA